VINSLIDCSSKQQQQQQLPNKDSNCIIKEFLEKDLLQKIFFSPPIHSFYNISNIMVENTKSNYDETPPLVEAHPVEWPVAPSAPPAEDDIDVFPSTTTTTTTTQASAPTEMAVHSPKQIKRAAGLASGIIGL
jgi:hypothetical protein